MTGKLPTPAQLDALIARLPRLRACGVARVELGPVVVVFDAQLTPSADAGKVKSVGQLQLALASAATAAQPEAPPAPAATAGHPAEHAADDVPGDDLDLGHLA